MFGWTSLTLFLYALAPALGLGILHFRDQELISDVVVNEVKNLASGD